ncbi:MAG TPA: SDR family oxidoreductase [Phycisphaerales bacterium]|nr:SDR family oxidoreductase [Phycisphaerales bacterium]
MGNVAAKVALITGAGSGIGRATALRLAREGFTLALVGRTGRTLSETAAVANVRCEVVPADLTDAHAAAEVIDRCVDRLGRVDVLVNNAGHSPAATIAETTPVMASEIFALNAVAPCVAIARAWPVFERQHRESGVGGVIVNVSSIATLDPFETLYAYAAAKAGVNLLARSAAKSGARIGVRAFSVAPGAVETPLLRTLVPESALPTSKTLSPDAVAEVIAECILGSRNDQNGRTIWMPSP